MKILRRIALVLLLLAAAAGIAYGLRPSPIAVDTARAFAGPMRLTVDEEGRTRIRERHAISAPLTGRLRRITLDPGDAVEAGETTVAVIEPTPADLLDPRAIAGAEARVRAAEAAIARAESLAQRAQAEYDLAESTLGRVREADRAGAANPQELDRAIADERTAAEGRRAALAEADIARFELEVAQSALLYARGETPEAEAARMALTSPIDGVVLRVFRESVAVVTAGEPLLEVGDPGDLEIVIDVLSADGVRITPGDPVIVEHWGGEEALEAVVRLVEPSAYTQVSALGIEEQRVDVVADFTSPREARASLGDGFRVEARIVIWSESSTLQAPASAVFRNGDAWAAFVVEDGIARLRHVGLGRRNDRFVQVLSGLAAGDVLVKHPGDQLADGVRVRVREDGE